MSEILIASHLNKTWTAEQFMGLSPATQLWVSSARQDTTRVLPAIRDISFSVEAGEIFGLVGPSGSGKSTLLGLLSGRITLDSGCLQVENQEHAQAPGRSKTAPRICLISKMTSSQVFNRMGAVENLLYGARLQGINGNFPDSKSLEHRVVSLLADLGLSQAEMAKPLVEAHFITLQKVVIGRALISQPDILLIDEITDGMDLENRQQVLDVLKFHNCCFGTTMILATRSLRTAATICDRIAFLSQGKISHMIETGSAVQRHEDAGLSPAHDEEHLFVEIPACELQSA